MSCREEAPWPEWRCSSLPPTVQKSEDRETDFFLDEVNLSNLLKCAFNNKYKNLYLESFHILNNTFLQEKV